MIVTLRGEISQIEDNAVIVEVNGVGVRVFVPRLIRERFQIGNLILLHTHLIMREDSLSLYGFETVEERQLFVMLLGVAGVGPRTALALLSGGTMEIIHKAVFNDEPELLGRIPGVGKKTAQKIVLHLHDRLKPINGLEKIVAMSDADTEVLAALTTLGYSVVEAQSAIQSIPNETPDKVEERLRIALQFFTGK